MSRKDSACLANNIPLYTFPDTIPPMPDSPTPAEIRVRLRELGYLKNPLDRFVFGGGSTGGALKLALGAGLRGALIAGPLLAGFGIILLGDELAPDEKLSWFLAFTVLFGLVIFLWVIAQALLIHFVARRSGRSMESLPVVILILAGTGLLLPALLWLLASGKIHSATLNAGFSGALLAAIALLATASFTIFSSSRAAAILATGNLETLARNRNGFRSVLLGLALLVMIGGVLHHGSRSKPDAAFLPVESKQNPLTAKGKSLRIIAVDGVRTGELAPALGASAVKLTEYSADSDLITGWLKIQTGHRNWKAQKMTGYRGIWGGRSHGEGSAPYRLLHALSLLHLAKTVPLPGLYSRPQYFWEVLHPKPVRVIGGWRTYPLSGRTSTIISDRAILFLTQGKSPEGMFISNQVVSAKALLGFYNLQKNENNPGLTIDEFSRESISPNIGWHQVERETLSWIYLPGADIVCIKASTQCSEVKTSNRDFLRSDIDHSIILIENPGRQGGTGAIWFRPAKDETIRPVHAPEELAAAVLDYLGYPLSAELAGVKPEEAQIASYGRIVVEDSGESDDATLKALKSLGYLQ
jgi:hypothetical protein